MNSKTSNWDYSFEVVVVGSGNGAMTAALSLYEMGVRDVVLIEKEALYGGCSALSGGGVWIPNSHYAKAAGAVDSYDEALTYLRATTPEGSADDIMQQTFLQRGPEMLRFMHDHTHARYLSLGGYPDYFSDLNGVKSGHRSMEPEPFDITRLADNGKRLRQSHPMMAIAGLVPFTQQEALILVGQYKGWFALAAKLVAHYVFDIPQRLKTARSRRATVGAAGIGRLALSLEERDIPIWTSVAMTDLVTQGERVVGITANKQGQAIRIQARKAVILASGGFDQNQEMREKYLPKPTNVAWSAGHKGNTGIPLAKAITLGAATKEMDGGWWTTTMKVPGEYYPRPSIMEKSYPGNCVVNRLGQRVANESQNYLMYVKACFAAKKRGVPVDDLWMVFDARFRANYIVGPLMTSRILPDILLPKRYYSDTFLTKANTITELARKTGIDVAGLSDTITKMNSYAETGVDLDLNRGGFEYDRYYGDPTVTPNPCLHAISKPPFYAIRLYLGDFGTHGGLVITPDAEVKHKSGAVIPGLYATGNCVAPTIPTYAGPGSTLGPAMTFGYLAAKKIAGYQAQGDNAENIDQLSSRRLQSVGSK